MWKTLPFEKCIQKVKTPFKLPKKEYSENGEFPVVSQETALISGYHDDANHLFKVDAPVVIFGDHTQVLKYIDFSFVMGADGVKILKPIREIDAKYFYYALTTLMPNTKGYARHYKLLKELNIPFPPLAEQQRIVAKLDAAFAEIDKAIELFEVKQAQVEQLKASLLSLLLNGNEWKTVKLGDVVSFDKNNGKGCGLPYVGMENISSESMQLVGDIEIPESTSSTFVFDDSHVLYGRLRPYLKKVLLPDFKGQCSTEIFCIKPKEELLRGYLAYWLLNPRTASAIEKTSTGARMPRANMNAILDFQIPLPPLAEQQRIVAKLDAAFAEIDRALSATNASIEGLQRLKSAMLAQELQPPQSEAA